MRPFLLLSLLNVLIVSCSKYQYMSVSSHEMEKNEQQEFVTENDSIEIHYNFSGLNAPVQLYIKNKSTEPVYIDWKRSALIVNGQAVSYYNPTVTFRGTNNSAASLFNFNRDVTFTSGSFSGSATLPEFIEFIPPGSYITKTHMGVTNQFFEYPPDSAFRRVYVQSSAGSALKIKGVDFSEDNSPLVFKSYLTVISAGSSTEARTFENTFYISRLYKSALGPSNFSSVNAKEGDQFYVMSKSGFGKAAEGVAIVAGTALITTAVLQSAKYSQSK